MHDADGDVAKAKTEVAVPDQMHGRVLLLLLFREFFRIEKKNSVVYLD